jgi:hypothetical protein
MRIITLLCCAFSVTLVACSSSDGSVYTLYRSSPADASMRIHVASFDSDESEKYNQENCAVVVNLMQRQPGVTARYWCEKGRFRK